MAEIFAFARRPQVPKLRIPELRLLREDGDYLELTVRDDDFQVVGVLKFKLCEMTEGFNPDWLQIYWPFWRDESPANMDA